MKHTCHARNCPVVTDPKVLMCKKHWFMVPKNLRDNVWNTFKRRGRDVAGPGWRAYLDAADAAILNVFIQEKEST